jgi:anti-anti-sigma factor
MTLQQETRGDITIFKPSGRLDSASSAGLEQAVLDRLQAGGKRLVFDLSGVDYISSAGLRVILLAGKKLQPVQGALVLCGLRDEVRGVFEMSGFLGLFATTPDLDQALAQV